MHRSLVIALSLLGTPAFAETNDRPRISVIGEGSVSNAPDQATINFGLRGEGRTSNEAVRVLVAKREAIRAVVVPYLSAEPTGGEVSIEEVRDRACDPDANDAPRLSAGACAIIGYVAQSGQQVRTGAVDRAATAVGLITGAGGVDARVCEYRLADPRPAQRRAMAAALADARQRAQVIADGAGVRLGALLAASDGSEPVEAQDIVVTAQRYANAPPLVSPPPIAIDLNPRPVETTARAAVSYAILP